MARGVARKNAKGRLLPGRKGRERAEDKEDGHRERANYADWGS